MSNVLISLTIATTLLGRPLAGQSISVQRLSASPEECEVGCTVRMFPSNSGWLAGFHGPLYRTDDGGRHWKELPLKVETLSFPTVTYTGPKKSVILTLDNVLVVDQESNVTRVGLPDMDHLYLNAGFTSGEERLWLAGGRYERSPGPGFPDAPNYAVKKYPNGDWGVLKPSIWLHSEAAALWREIRLPECSWQVKEVGFWDELHGYALGDLCSWYTETGGETWSKSTFIAGKVVGFRFPADARVASTSIVGGGEGWLLFDEKSLYQTEDAGKTWQRAAVLPGSADAIAFLDEQAGFVLMSSGALRRTTDGGKSFGLIKLPITVRALSVVDASNVVVLSLSGIYRFSIK